MRNSRAESGCLVLCCFNLLRALQKETFVRDAINFSALCVYGCEFNSRDINIYFSSIFTVACAVQTTAEIIRTLQRELLWDLWFILALTEP